MKTLSGVLENHNPHFSTYTVVKVSGGWRFLEVDGFLGHMDLVQPDEMEAVESAGRIEVKWGRGVIKIRDSYSTSLLRKLPMDKVSISEEDEKELETLFGFEIESPVGFLMRRHTS